MKFSVKVFFSNEVFHTLAPNFIFFSICWNIDEIKKIDSTILKSSTFGSPEVSFDACYLRKGHT